MSEIPELKQILEGAIMAADKPLSIDGMILLFGDEGPDKASIQSALEEIKADCENRGFELREVASGYRFQVRAKYGEWVSRLWEEKPPRYTRALLETLALIAYKQPITRGDIEEIRGVTVSTNIMRTLLEREWIRVVGHRDVPGRPAIYATTRSFLDYFNLTSLDELPTLSEIKDLDKVNEELDLAGEHVEARILELGAQLESAVDVAEDESLEEVTQKVNQIQENIKNLFRSEAEADVALDDLEENPDLAAGEFAPDQHPQADEETMQEPAEDQQVLQHNHNAEGNDPAQDQDNSARGESEDADEGESDAEPGDVKNREDS